MYLIFSIALTVCFLLALVLALTKKWLQSAKFERISALVFGALFVARFYSHHEYAIDNITGLAQSPLSPFLTVLTTVSVWMGYAAVMLLILKPFYKVSALSEAVKFFCTPVMLLMSVCLVPNATLMIGPDAVEKLTFPVIMYALEAAFGLGLCLFEWARNPRFPRPRALPLLRWAGGILALSLCSLPSYTFQVLFGEAPGYLVVDNLTVTHRLFIYAAFILPLIIYFVLRNKDKELIRFAVTFMNLALMVTFCSRLKYDTFLQPTAWPLHLCNTAMFIIPICLVFRMEKLFYFTYFINVAGAFFAMAMPNYEHVTMFQWRLVNFWVNHYPAFFMPLLLVALKVFDRPKIKQFYYSMVGFFFYFVTVLFLNAWFSNYNAEVDFFFLNSNFVADQLGQWAENIFNLTASFHIGELEFVFHPLYQFLFFLVYVGIALAMWFIYSECFAIADAHYEMMLKKQKIRIDKLALKATLNGRSIEEPMNPDANIQLELRHFSKRYARSKVYAVNDANLVVRGGEIFGFLGPNGAGKSTIIKSIVGIQPITEGAIEVCGYDCEKQPRQAKSQIGFVPDHYALYEKLTGREYINYIADIYNVSEEDRTARIEEMVKLFELEHSFDSSMKTYSHGMKQKITIMAALVHNPKLWILDEPLTGLDPNSIFQVKECMRRHAEAGNIVFFSSHIIDVVERICDRIAIIKKGQIMCTRTVEEIEAECPLEEFYMKTINDSEFAQKVLQEESKRANA